MTTKRLADKTMRRLAFAALLAGALAGCGGDKAAQQAFAPAKLDTVVVAADTSNAR